MLLAALRSRFGDRPEIPDAARRLASWPDLAAFQAINAATDPAVLLTIEPEVEQAASGAVRGS
jgi:hypothetical protein